MSHTLYKALAFAMLITLTGCCLAVDCGYNDGLLKLQLMRGGKNALYGPDSFPTQEDVKLIVLAGDSLHEEYIEFDTSLQVIKVYIFTNPTTILEIKYISSDTLSFTSEKLSNKGCCDEYQTTGVLKNGEVIGEGRCDGVVEVQI